MNFDVAISIVHSVSKELVAQVNGDRDALQRALQEKAKGDEQFAEALFQYEKFHKICDESPRH